MDTKLLEDILACPTLPSLPAIAVQVIELTNDQNVSMDELAELIQTDQAMSARILRTVNSSFYGLRERCTTIKKALVLLGLSPVKSLALGFSLVSSMDKDKDPAFDYVSYWRRGLFTAVAAKTVADAARLPEADECFISGLLQDIGVIAMLQTLKGDYVSLLASIDGDHNRLSRAELAKYDAQHADIGATLATRWKLPEQLAVPIKYHERPTAAPEEHATIAKCVTIGNIAHDVVTEEDSTPHLRMFYRRCSQWLDLDEDACDEALKRFGEATKELSDLFNLDTGDDVNPEVLLAQAEETLIKITEAEPERSPGADRLHGLLHSDEHTDPLTGLPNARGFEELLNAKYTDAESTGVPISLIQIVIDGLNTVCDAGGLLASDAVFIRAIAFLQQHLEPMGGVVCRAGTGIISIVLPETRENQLIAAINQFRAQFDACLPTLLAPMNLGTSTVTTSIGLATAAPESFEKMKSAKGLIAAATKAALSARQAGGNCVRTFSVRKAA